MLSFILPIFACLHHNLEVPGRVEVGTRQGRGAREDGGLCEVMWGASCGSCPGRGDSKYRVGRAMAALELEEASVREGSGLCRPNSQPVGAEAPGGKGGAGHTEECGAQVWKVKRALHLQGQPGPRPTRLTEGAAGSQ